MYLPPERWYSDHNTAVECSVMIKAENGVRWPNSNPHGEITGRSYQTMKM